MQAAVNKQNSGLHQQEQLSQQGQQEISWRKGRFTPTEHSGWTVPRKQTEEGQGLARPQENVLIIARNYKLLCAAFKFGFFLSKSFIPGEEMQSTPNKSHLQPQLVISVAQIYFSQL